MKKYTLFVRYTWRNIFTYKICALDVAMKNFKFFRNTFTYISSFEKEKYRYTLAEYLKDDISTKISKSFNVQFFSFLIIDANICYAENRGHQPERMNSWKKYLYQYMERRKKFGKHSIDMCWMVGERHGVRIAE